jgi:cytochrome c oxidase subunit 1
MVLTYRQWRKERPVERIPLLAYVSMLTFIMWFIASLGIAIEVLVFILPWSIGWKESVDPQLTRTLFWFTGHPIVYFWLLPVYVSWYMMLPKMCGGRIFSDGLTRVVFIAFLVLIPVGVHHQFTDPGIPFSSKTIMWILTVCIFMPSVATAFSIVAGLEEGGRKRGGKGLLGWVWKLPWGDPAVSGQLLAGLVFMLGGASGLINASYTVNLQVHNTAFIPGHFHLTVGTGVALSIMAISYWLVPYFTGKQLFARGLAVFQTFLWVAGVLTFSRGQMWGGMNGMPRRTKINDAVYLDNHAWDWANILTGVGGTIMVISSVLFFVVIIGTIYSRRLVTETQRIPVVDVAHGPRRKWVILDNPWLWVGITIALVALVYGEVFWHYQLAQRGLGDRLQTQVIVGRRRGDPPATGVGCRD